MKKIVVFLTLILCNAAILSNPQNKIVEAIENSDPEALRDLLIPGLLITTDVKNKLIKLAQETTNSMHAQLHSYHFSDGGSVIKGLFKGSIGLTLCVLAADFLSGNREFGTVRKYLQESPVLNKAWSFFKFEFLIP